MSASIGGFTAANDHGPLADARKEGPQSHDGPWDSVESYFECITACSLDDGACITHCVEILREHH